VDSIPILSIVLWLPLVAAIVVLFLPERRAMFAVAAAGSALTLLLSIVVWASFESGAGMQFRETFDWLPALGIQYALGVDGISLLMVLLNTFLFFLCIVYAWASVHERVKEYLFTMLLLEVGITGVFLALDFVLFYVFWEIMLIPMYVLIGVWGGERRVYATLKFVLYTLFGSLLMLVAILALYFVHGNTTGVYTFEILELTQGTYGERFQLWAFLAFFLAFAIKVPMVPFHTWLPDAHVEAPTTGSVILAGILLKMGGYGFIRFSLPLFPDASQIAQTAILVLSVIAILYGALVALMQTDLKKLIAYSSVSHMGFVTLGIFSFTQQGIDGAMMQMFSHGLVTGALFLCVGQLYERTHDRMIVNLGGLAHRLPVFAALFLFFSFASIGLPGLSGFVGEFMVLLGAFVTGTRIYGVLAVFGIILSAAYMLWMFWRVMLGSLKEAHQRLQDLTLLETGVLAALAVVTIWAGVQPQLFIGLFSADTSSIVQALTAPEAASLLLK
jgi:NADH-quinone oxidoreductase subunit M